MPKTPKGPQVMLHITPEIIQMARPRDSNHCMIADALKVAYPDAKAVAVDLATIRFTDRAKGLRYTYLTPRVAQVHLVQFDQGVPVQPIKFNLRGAHVTYSGTKATRLQKLSEAALKQRQEAGKSAAKKRARTKLVSRDGASGSPVPDRIGGKTPPLQKGKDNVPFSRRRAFGLRALEY